MKKGIIYSFINKLINLFKYLNVVELFKYIALKLYKKDRILASRAGVDIFIILKWLFIVVIWYYNCDNNLVNMIVWYLIFTNVFTYFYYHTWTTDLSKPNFDLDRVKRRFLNLLLAVAFNVFCFAYLFAKPFSKNFKWPDNVSNTWESILFSLANSLTVSFDPVTAINQTGHTIILMETIVTFVFLTIVLSNSIPQIKTD